MTVSDPGAGQQQGRECGLCYDDQRCPGYCAPEGVDERHLTPTPSPTPPARDSVKHNHLRFRNDGGPWSKCPEKCPARDSGRDEARERDTQLDTSVPFSEAREAVARWLTSETLINDGATWSRRVAQDAADELLALPELEKLLRRPA